MLHRIAEVEVGGPLQRKRAVSGFRQPIDDRIREKRRFIHRDYRAEPAVGQYLRRTARMVKRPATLASAPQDVAHSLPRRRQHEKMAAR